MKKSSLRFMISGLMLVLTATAFSCSGGTQQTSDAHLHATPAETNPSQAVPDANTLYKDQAGVDWPCFHGADHSNKSPETGLLQQWPDGGPKLLMTVQGLGAGYATVSIADGYIFTAGSDDNQTLVYACDLNGNLVWKKPNGSAWKVEVQWAKGFDGPRSTPTYDEGMVYHLSELNRLTAYKAKTGDEVWSRDLMKDFECTMPDYGFTESVMIDGNKLFVRPAGKKGFQVCLNKLTGETIWVNNEIPGSYAYNSSVIYDFGGYRQLISASSTCYFGVDCETGKLLWKVDFTNNLQINCTDAVITNDHVLMSCGLGGGTMLVRMKPSGNRIETEKVWKTELMDNYHGGVIYHDGYYYGSGDRSRGWFSIDMKAGQQMWKNPGGMGSLTYADGMLYLLDEKGMLRLVKASPERFEVAGELKVPRGDSKPYWAHPVVCGGRLYVRHGDKLFVYDVRNP